MGNLLSRKQNASVNTNSNGVQATKSPATPTPVSNGNGRVNDENSWKFVAQSVDLNGSICNGSMSNDKYETPQARTVNLMDDSKNSPILPIDHDSSELTGPTHGGCLNQSQTSNEVEMMKQLEEKLLSAAINDDAGDEEAHQQSGYNIQSHHESAPQPCTPVNSLCQMNPYLNNDLKQQSEAVEEQVVETKAPLAAQEDHSFSFQHDTTAEQVQQTGDVDEQFEQEIVSGSNQVQDLQTDDDDLDDYPVIELQPTTNTTTSTVRVPPPTPVAVETMESNEEALETIQALDDMLNAAAQQSSTIEPETGVKFRFEYANPEGVEISGCKLAGSFNNWSEYLDLALDQATHKWFLEMCLEPDTYEYKFILNGSDWKCDYTKPTRNDNNFIELARGC